MTSLMTYYDGIVTLVFLPFMSACCGGAATMAALVTGSFLLIPKVWSHWRRFWPLSIVLFLASSAVYVASFDAAYMVTVEHPEFPGQTLDVPNPSMGLIGCLGMVICITYCPLIGFSPSKKWY